MFKIAIIHDWLVESGGAEKVLAELINIFPQADIYSTVDYLSDSQRDTILKGKSATTTFIQNLPKSKSYKKYFPLMPMAVANLDLSDYKLVISCSSSVAKGVITGPDQVHVCYCHSPMRYAWDLQHQYLKESGLDRGLKGFLAKLMLHRMRQWDVTSSFGVDHFIANSNFIARRIKKVYRRDAEVIYPNVAVEDFEVVKQKSDYYFTCSRMVPYKKIDLIVEAFANMPDKKLVVIGDGPEMEKIKSMSTSNIELMGYQSFSILKDKMANAKAFVFAAEEDFGIVPVEAQACGTPVIAFGKGGSLETVKENISGVFFNEQSVESLSEAVGKFESMSFDAIEIRAHAERFSTDNFSQKIKDFISMKLGN
ncbi:MAG: glycosyltransferase involved in cell wall biosynthesis [Paraglaciecola sp.]|jgi:glycosyltransferase involved in cell wall biosynthesis